MGIDQPFGFTAPVDDDVRKFQLDRELASRLRPLPSADGLGLRHSIEVFPSSMFPGVPIRDLIEYTKRNRAAVGYTSFPDLDGLRSTSLGVVGGNPVTSLVGATGLVTHVDINDGVGPNGSVVYPHWWHEHLRVVLRWASSYYQSVGYAGSAVVNLTLDGLDGLQLIFTERNDPGGHRSLESSVHFREEVSIEDLTDRPDEIALDLTSRACAAFNWYEPLDRYREALHQ